MRLAVVLLLAGFVSGRNVEIATDRAAPNSESSWQSLDGVATTFMVLRPGSGQRVVTPRSSVTVHAKGSVEQSGYTFWDTRDPGQTPFQYTAGVGQVIVGWDRGCLGMQVGELRRLRIPPQEGYGVRGFPAWKIPPGANLLFDIEVLSIG